MKNAHMIAWAVSQLWALMPERMAAYTGFFASHCAGQLPPAAAKDRTASSAPARQSAGRGSSIAVISVFGAMVEWPGDIDVCDGGTSSRVVSQQLADAENDETVSQVLMVFNTPGGSVYGTSELADAINRVKASKPVIGVAQSLAASAGYWVLSQCTEAYCSPGGEVGSIGVYSAHQNIKKALDMAGVDIQLFSAGKYKTEMSPFGESLTPEAIAFQEKRANDYYAMFTKAVAKGRRVSVEAVRRGMGEGRVLGADDALAANMIDGIMTFEQLAKKMQSNMRSGRLARSAPSGSTSRPGRSAQARRNEIELLSI